VETRSLSLVFEKWKHVACHWFLLKVETRSLSLVFFVTGFYWFFVTGFLSLVFCHWFLVTGFCGVANFGHSVAARTQYDRSPELSSV
jgi:hypothetical protein